MQIFRYLVSCGTEIWRLRRLLGVFAVCVGMFATSYSAEASTLVHLDPTGVDNFVSGFAGNRRQWRKMESCVAEKFGTFDMEFVVRPPANQEYISIRFGGGRSQALMATVNGKANQAGQELADDMAIVFSDALDNSPQDVCHAVVRQIDNTLARRLEQRFRRTKRNGPVIKILARESVRLGQGVRVRVTVRASAPSGIRDLYLIWRGAGQEQRFNCDAIPAGVPVSCSAEGRYFVFDVDSAEGHREVAVWATDNNGNHTVSQREYFELRESSKQERLLELTNFLE